MSPLHLLIALAVAIVASEAKLPSFIDLCKRNDPQLNTCFTNSVNKLRPHLIKGIHELQVPAIDPLELAEVKVSQIFGDWNKVILKNIKIHGAGDFKVSKINVNLKNNEFSGEIQIDNLSYEGDYFIDSHFMHLSMKGQGHIKGSASGIRADFHIQGEQLARNDGKYFNFNTMTIRLKVDRTQASVDGLIRGEVVMGDGVQNTKEADMDLWGLLKPVAEQTIANVVMEIVNKITAHANVNEIFPE